VLASAAMRPLLLAFLVACGGTRDPGDPGTSDGGTDANNGGPTRTEQGLLLATPDRTGPIEWIPVDDSGLQPRVTLVSGIDPALRQSVWGFSDDGSWLFYGLDNKDATLGSLWVRYLDHDPQRVDDASKPYWSGLTWTNNKLFFVGGSDVAFAVDLPASGVASSSTRVSREGKSVFAVPIAASKNYVAMHYYGFRIPIVRVVQSMSALGTDMNECCSFGYYWNLAPQWGNASDRQLMVAGADYDHRDLSVAAATDTSPTTVHAPAQHGGLSVQDGSWSSDDRLIAYTVKMTIENLSHHLFIADVSGAPQRIEVTSVHTTGVAWRPGTNTRQVAYAEYPKINAQERIMLATIQTDPLRVTTRPLIEHAPSPIFAILYEWNADGTAILHHGGAAGEYTVTFVDDAGNTKDVPLGLFFREQDTTTKWSIPYLAWSKDGRRLICRTNTGHSIASIDVATQKVTAPIALPTDIDFAWWDRRLASGR
jgi:hypothetical protein